MITLSNASKTFPTAQGSLSAVNGVSLHVAPGDILGIVGFSGAGKSTLLRMINLLERPDPGGQVIVAGENLARLKPAALNAARHAIGMIFQNFNLLANRSVFDNVSLPLEIAFYPAARRRARVLECLDIVGLADKAASYPAKLSGGQKQRVAIARALANAPHVLLCDEPTSSLDPQTTDSILGFLRRINEQFGTTIVVVTHEMHVVRSICNTVGVMEQGRLVERFGLAVIPWSPLGGGLLTGKYERGKPLPEDSRFAVPNRVGGRRLVDGVYEVVSGLAELASARGVPVSQLATAWVMQQPGITAPIIGPRTEAQFEDAIAAADITLAAEELAKIDTIVPPGSFVSPFYEGRFGSSAYRW